jgi:ABC-type maltose transport system permease subunit
MSTSDLIATIGVSLLLIAFFLQILKVIKTESVAYALLNLLGASIAGYASWLIAFMPFVILEAVWSLVALYSLFKILSKNNVSRETK